MDIRFDQIHDFQFRQATKLENSSYLEDLTGLLEKVASNIDDESNYFFGKEYYIENIEQEPNCNFNHFIDSFKNSFYNGSFRKIYIIRGRAGIGKSLFLKLVLNNYLRTLMIVMINI